ncbi:hypothetical protein LTR60_007419, partial [Cryomyces antarcticus]
LDAADGRAGRANSPRRTTSAPSPSRRTRARRRGARTHGERAGPARAPDDGRLHAGHTVFVNNAGVADNEAPRGRRRRAPVRRQTCAARCCSSSPDRAAAPPARPLRPHRQRHVRSAASAPAWALRTGPERLRRHKGRATRTWARELRRPLHRQPGPRRHRHVPRHERRLPGPD